MGIEFGQFSVQKVQDEGVGFGDSCCVGGEEGEGERSVQEIC